MKAALGILAGLLFATSAFAQSVVFQNTASTNYRISTNDGVNFGPLSGANGYRIGLYAAVGAGQPSGSLQLVGLGTNIAASVGAFNGGNPYFITAPGFA